MGTEEERFGVLEFKPFVVSRWVVGCAAVVHSRQGEGVGDLLAECGRGALAKGPLPRLANRREAEVAFNQGA
jgi:hypothetical protein